MSSLADRKYSTGEAHFSQTWPLILAWSPSRHPITKGGLVDSGLLAGGLGLNADSWRAFLDLISAATRRLMHAD